MDASTITAILGALVALITIVSTILGVGWKLGQIATGIETQIVEVKGEMRTLNAISGERINGIERRLTELERKETSQ
jgi:hypothetical protein